MQILTQKVIAAGNMMDLVKMTETISNFEKLFNDLYVNSAMMDQIFSKTTCF